MEREDREFFQRILNDHTLPYSKIEHIIRHAVLRHRDYVLQLIPIQKNGRRKYATLSMIRMERQRLLEETHFGLVLDAISPTILRLTGKQHRDVAALIVESLRSRVLNMKSPRLRELYLREIVERWTWIREIDNREGEQPRKLSLVQFPSPPKS